MDARLEVYAISDLHTDFAENMAWVEQLAATWGVAGRPAAGSRPTPVGATETAAAAAAGAGPEQPATAPGASAAAASAASSGDGGGDVRTVLLVAGDVSDCLATLE